MRITVDVELPGFEEALVGLLPAGIQLRGLKMDGERLRMALKAPMVGTVDLLARVQVDEGRLSLHTFDLEGAGFAKGIALGAIRQRIAGLDEKRGALHAFGESDGERLHLRWSGR